MLTTKEQQSEQQVERSAFNGCASDAINNMSKQEQLEVQCQCHPQDKSQQPLCE